MRLYIACIFLVGALSSCQRNQDPCSQNDLTQIAETPKDKALTKGTRNAFAIEAALGTMMEIESSAHMIKHTENRDIQNLATIMLKDHLMAERELKSLAKQSKLYVPQELPKDKLAVLKHLDGLDEFERNLFYAKLMVKEHETAVKLFSTASNNSDPKLAQFAANKLPHLEHHLAEARVVLDIMRKISGDQGEYPLKISQSRNNEHTD
jgi:putative membrane protein